mmetsp:Transcript_13400/g.26988  ORF Transcript_13400/g.26988 Transcript_13400/m.26988 type:complete len:104 (+) Transcript_13400:549-860(+)
MFRSGPYSSGVLLVVGCSARSLLVCRCIRTALAQSLSMRWTLSTAALRRPSLVEWVQLEGLNLPLPSCPLRGSSRCKAAPPSSWADPPERRSPRSDPLKEPEE